MAKSPIISTNIRKQAATTLNLYAMTPESYQLLWAQLDDSYFLDHEAQEIAWHTRLLAFKVNTTDPDREGAAKPGRRRFAGDGVLHGSARTVRAHL